MSTLVPITQGSVVKIWHNPKGIDYIVVGHDPIEKQVTLLKLTCLNNDGSVHAASQRFHKVLKYSQVGNVNLVKGVSYVVGAINFELPRIQEFLEYSNTHLTPLDSNFKVITRPDSTLSFSF